MADYKVHLRMAEVGWHNYGICSMYAYQSCLTDDPKEVTCRNCLRKWSKQVGRKAKENARTGGKDG